MYKLRDFVYLTGDFFLGTTIWEYRKILDNQQWWSKEQIDANRDEKLHKLLNYAYLNVPYWKKLFDEKGIKPDAIKSAENLSCLPILTKAEIRANLNEMTSELIPSKKLIANFSSGSTGEPLKYFEDKEHYSWRIASLIRFWNWAGYDFGKKWVRVSIWPHNKISQKIYDAFANCLYIQISGMGSRTIERDIRNIKKFQPEIIRGYASSVYLLAKYMEEHSITGINPKAVITTGDMLFEEYRQLIEKQFGCNVFDNYGGEGMMVSGQCEYGNHHIDDNGVIVEFITDDGTVAEEGELANLVITDLNNFAMPFIRYKIQDVGSYKTGQCQCGRKLSLINPVHGRESDVIVTGNNTHLIVVFFTGLMKFYKGIDQFKIVQTQKNEIEIRIVPNEKLRETDLEDIKQKIWKETGRDLIITFKMMKVIPLEKSGKRRFVVSYESYKSNSQAK